MDRKKLIYIGSLLILTVIVSVTYFSYAFWTNKDVQHAKINVVAGTLNYEVKGKGISNNAITIGGNTTKKIELTLKSLNEISSKYELYYTTTSNDIEVGYSSDTKDGITGTINEKGSKKITVFITNPTSSNITVTFGAEGGFTGNTLTRTQGKAIPSQESICTNYTTHVFNFDYTEDIQEFVAPCSGTYTMETWGAQGGSYNSTYQGGYGGYSVGDTTLSVNDSIYVTVGGKPTDNNQKGSIAVSNCGTNSGCRELIPGGYNGGGAGAHRGDVAFEAGGGATHIATVSGLLKDLEEYKDTGGTNLSNEILLVAGAGGGIGYYNDVRRGVAGSGGGYVGTNGSYTSASNCEGYGEGGTQTTGGSYFVVSNHAYINSVNIPDAGFGYGSQADLNIGGAGGGAGWYGGRGTSCIGGAGGGSSYIGSPNLSNKAMYCYDCEESTEEDTYTISTINSAYMQSSSACSNGYSTDPISKCAKLGNGYARITYYGTDTTKVTYDYNYLPNDAFEDLFNTNTCSACCGGNTLVSYNTFNNEYGKNYEIEITTSASDTSKNDGYFFSKKVTLSSDNKYSYQFDIKLDSNRTAKLGHEQGGLMENVNLTTEWQRITYTYTTDQNTHTAFSFYPSFPKEDNTQKIYVRNVQIQEGNPYTMDRNYIKGGTLSDIETPKRSGWTFAGWYTDPIGGTQVTSYTSVPNDDTTYYAHWTLNN